MKKEAHPLSSDYEKGGSTTKTLTKDDITNQGRLLLNNFIHERMESEGVQNVPTMMELQEPGTPMGPPMPHFREIARALRCIGDELDRDERLNSLISKIPPEAERRTFMNIAQQFFADGVYSWGRIAYLFYFAYKMAMKALDKIPLVRAIINFVVDFIRDKVAQWIIDRGGWDASVEYFGTPGRQMALIFGAGVVVTGAIYLYKRLR